MASGPQVTHRYSVGEQIFQGRFAPERVEADGGEIHPVIRLGTGRLVALDPLTPVVDVCDPDKPVLIWAEGRPTYTGNRPGHLLEPDDEAMTITSTAIRFVNVPVYAVLDHLHQDRPVADE